MKLIIIIVIYLLYSIFSGVVKAIKKSLDSSPPTPVYQPKKMAKPTQQLGQRKAIGSFGNINKGNEMTKSTDILLSPEETLDLTETKNIKIAKSKPFPKAEIENEDFQLDFAQPSVLYQAVVMSEILGEPRAKRPFSFQNSRK